MDAIYTNDIDYISLADHIMSNKRSNNYNLVTTTTNFDAIHSINDGNAQSILDVCSEDTKNSNDQESVAQSSTDIATPRVGKEYQVDLPNSTNCIIQDVEIQNTQPCKKILMDSSIASGASVVIQKGSLVWVGRDSVQNQAGVHSSEKTQSPHL